MIRLLVVDDNRTVQQSLTLLLSNADEIDLVGQAYTGLEALHMVASLQPDVVLIDIDMPEMDGITAIRIMHKFFPQIQTIVLSGESNNEVHQSARTAGAAAILVKGLSGQDVIDTIRATYQGCQACPNTRKNS